MSHSKRPWDNISSATIPSEVPLVKRRRPSVSSNLNDASDDVYSDHEMTSVTEESISTALSSVRSALNASPSPQKITNPAFPQSRRVSGNNGEQWPDRRGTCFGMVRSN